MYILYIMFIRRMFCISLLFLVYSINLSESIVSNGSIDKDISELSPLNEVLKYNLPSIYYETQATICLMIDNCCPNVKQNLSDYVNLGFVNINSLIPLCMNDEEINRNHEMCSTFETDDAKKFVDILHQMPIDMNIPSVCSADEAYAVFCDWVSQEKIESCERKRLTYVAQYKTEKEYQTFVEQSKQQIKSILNTIHQVFPTLKKPSNSAMMINRTDFILVLLIFLKKIFQVFN